MIIALKTIRESKGISADEIADRTGLTKLKIWNYESGRNQPDPEALCKIADVLDVSLDMLVRGKEKDRPAGRSLTEVAKGFKALSDEHLEMMIATANAVLAERRFQVRQEKERKETE